MPSKKRSMSFKSDNRHNKNKNTARSKARHTKNTAPSGTTSLPTGSSQQVWFYGNHPVQSVLKNESRAIELIALTKAQMDNYSELITQREIPYVFVSRDDLNNHFSEDALHQGVAVLTRKLPPFAIEDLQEKEDTNQTVVILDQVTDPHNVGAILRSSAIFGAQALILTDKNAPEESAILAKSASGGLEEVPLIYVNNLARALDQLKEYGFWTVGFAGEAEQNLGDIDIPNKVALIMGAEGEGMRRLTREKCDYLTRIPMSDNQVGSLNVSNAAAIALYETFKQKS